MNPENIPGELSEAPAQCAHIEISPTLLAKLNTIANSEPFAANATVESAFTDVEVLVREILNAPAAYPTWRIDDLQEQLASSRRITDQLASGNFTPNHGQGDKIPYRPIYVGNHEALEGFVAQLHLQLFSNTT